MRPAAGHPHHRPPSYSGWPLRPLPPPTGLARQQARHHSKPSRPAPWRTRSAHSLLFRFGRMQAEAGPSQPQCVPKPPHHRQPSTFVSLLPDRTSLPFGCIAQPATRRTQSRPSWLPVAAAGPPIRPACCLVRSTDAADGRRCSPTGIRAIRPTTLQAKQRTIGPAAPFFQARLFIVGPRSIVRTIEAKGSAPGR